MPLLHDKCEKCHSFLGNPKNLFRKFRHINGVTTRNYSRVCKEEVDARVRQEDLGELVKKHEEKKDVYRCVQCGRTQKTAWYVVESWEEWKDDECE